MRQRQRASYEVTGAQLAGERCGDGAPTIVFLHQGVCDRRAWDGVIAHLPEHGTKVAYDMRGYGETPPDLGIFSNLEDLLEVLDQVADEPVWLVGGSLGGGVALDCALTEPGRVAGLILLSPGISGAPEPDLGDLDENTLHFGELIDQARAAAALDEVSRLEAWLWLDGPNVAEGRVGGEARRLALSMNAIALRNGQPEGAGEANRPDAWHRLEEVAVPTTVACGDLDIPFLVTQSRLLANRVPGANHQVLTAMAHLSNVERPEEIAKLIADALQEASTA